MGKKKKKESNVQSKPDSHFSYNQSVKKETKKTDSWFDHEYYWNDDHLDEPVMYDGHDSVVRSYPITMYPNKKQKEKLLIWFGLLNKVYNEAVKYCRNNKPITKGSILRDIVRPKMSKHLWKRLKEEKVNADCINESICDVSKAYDTCFANLKAKNIKHFRVRYKKASKPKQCIIMTKNTFGTRNGFCLGPLGVMKSSKPINKYITQKTCRLVYTKGKFTLWVPENKGTKKVLCRQESVGLDPGLRTFQTTYDGKNYMKFGNNSFRTLRKHIKIINKTKSMAKKAKIKRLHKRLFKKIGNIVDDMHWKVAKFLVTNYDTIFIGKLSTKGVVSKRGNLAKICKQPIIHLKHFTFRTRLIAKAEEYGAKVVCVNEAYTSQACGKCGNKNKKLGTAKKYKCIKAGCDYKIDRDFNGARNILRKGYGISIC